MRAFLLALLLLPACEGDRTASDPLLTEERRSELCDRMCQHFEECALDRAACLADCGARPIDHVRDAAFQHLTECAEHERCVDLPDSLALDCASTVPETEFHRAFDGACAATAMTCGSLSCPDLAPFDASVVTLATACLDESCAEVMSCLAAATPGW